MFFSLWDVKLLEKRSMESGLKQKFSCYNPNAVELRR